MNLSNGKKKNNADTDITNNSLITEQIAHYEGKIKSWKDKIRAELKIRQNLKGQLKEAKNREALQILMLERLDEYEEIVTKQLESTEKMEDSESVKQLSLIEKYESMLREQKEVWAKYEERYENLPLAQERKKAETQLLNVTIKKDSVACKLKEVNKIIKMERHIGKRLEQLKIIELAKLYLEQKKKEKYCSELMTKIHKLRLEENNLKQLVKDAEKQAEEMKKPIPVLKKSIKSQQLPKVDLSSFIIRRDNNHYNNYDTISINSYALEQEYMNADELVNSQSLSQPFKQSVDSQQQNLDESIDINFESIDMDGEPKELNKQKNQSQDVDKADDNSKMDVDGSAVDQAEAASSVVVPSSSHRKSQNQTSNATNFENHGDPSRRAYSNPFSHNKNSTQESQLEIEHIDKRGTPQKRAVIQQHAEASSRGFVRVGDESANYASPYRIQERPVPSPAKLQRQTMIESPQKYYQQQKQQEQQQKQQQEQQQQLQQQYQPHQQQQRSFLKNDSGIIFSSNDLTRLPQANNKQLFKPNDSFENSTNKFQRSHFDHQTPKVHPYFSSTGSPRQSTSTLLESQRVDHPSSTPQKNFSFVDGKQQQQQHQQQRIPTFASNYPNTPSIASCNITFNSGDVNMLADNISAILGSEITEPGGSFELVRRIYGDSDVASEVSDLDYEKIMEKVFSPISAKGNNQQEHQQHQQQQSDNKFSQVSVMSLNSALPLSDSQGQNEQGFALTGFGKKTTKNTKTLF